MTSMIKTTVSDLCDAAEYPDDGKPRYNGAAVIKARVAGKDYDVTVLETNKFGWEVILEFPSFDPEGDLIEAKMKIAEMEELRESEERMANTLEMTLGIIRKAKLEDKYLAEVKKLAAEERRKRDKLMLKYHITPLTSTDGLASRIYHKIYRKVVRP